MVAYLGMSKEIGNLSFYESSESAGFNLTKPYSEKTAERLDAEVKKLIDDSYARALGVLKEHESGLVQLAELLLEREVIFAEDLEQIFGKRKKETTPAHV
jgi:cell division protease FtsH